MPFVLLPIFLIGFWAKSIFNNSSGSLCNETPMPLCELVHYLLGSNDITQILVILFLVFITLFGLNRINTRYQLLSRQGVLPGLMFLIFVSGYTDVQKFLDIWFFIPLMVFSIDRLFFAATKKESSIDVFYSFFLVSIGTLFYGKGVYFFPMFIWALVLINIFSFRYFLVAVIGCILPYFFAWSIYFLMDRQIDLFNNFIENIASPVAYFDHTIFSKVYNSILVFFIFISILLMMRMLNTLKILVRKYLRVFIWLVIYSIILAATPFFSMEIVPVIGVGASMLIANYLESFKSKFWQETVFTLFVILTLTIQLI
ncbi:MAG: hypothetical protein JW717_02090 [Marinilabiliaceae bacterium]|nr:hypothetical protein [Marinilabiliaceae bacterium]